MSREGAAIAEAIGCAAPARPSRMPNATAEVRSGCRGHSAPGSRTRRVCVSAGSISEPVIMQWDYSITGLFGGRGVRRNDAPALRVGVAI